VTVVERIAYIQALFQQVNVTETINTPLEETFTDVDLEYISVIYEAEAAKHAKNDLKNGQFDVPNWLRFKEKFALQHGSQIHVGLGWAMAECSVLSCSVLSGLSSEFQWRVWDGFGYYSGLFNRRETVRLQNYPPDLNPEWSSAFDQGLGRSFWYIAQANSERVASMIHLFSEERQTNIWRGVGLAMSYIGGLKNSLVNEVLQKAETDRSAVRCGALLALEGKEKAGIDSQLFKELRAQLRLPESTSWKVDDDFKNVLSDMESQLALIDA